MGQTEKTDVEAALSPDRRALHMFARSRDIEVATFEVSGIHLAMANILAGWRSVTASGSGYTEGDAVAACLGEAAEFLSWQWREEDRGRLIVQSSDADLHRIDAKAALGFSAEQIAKRHRLNRAWDGFDRIPPAATLGGSDAYIHVTDLEGNAAALCPAFLAFGGFGSAQGDPTLDVDSNGCAAGPDILAAKMRALLELVERDATGIWWHLGRVAPRYERSQATDPVLRQGIETHLRETGRRLWFLDISALSQACVIAAVSCERDGSDTMFGFGVGLDANAAARAAFRELVQGEVALDAWRQRRSEGRAVPEDRRLEKWLSRADIRRMRFAIGTESQWLDRTSGGFDALLRGVRENVGEPWFVDLSRADIGIPVVKAIVAGMAHYKPRLGVGRLFDAHLTDRTTRQPKIASPHKLLI